MRSQQNPIPAYRASRAAAALFAVAALLPCASHAAERILLTNGFDVICDHHVQIGGRIRVYMGPQAEDYLDLKPEAVQGFEILPDPPKETAPVAVAPPKAQPAANSELTKADLQQLLAKVGSEHNVNEDLLASLVKAESGGNVHAKSRAGAQGLMQLMPGTARQLGVSDSFAPEQNVRGGTAYLDSLLTRYHDNIALALAAYNAGPEAVDHYRGIPPYRETRVYVAKVIHEFNRRVKTRQADARQVNTKLAAASNRPVAYAATSATASTGLGNE